MELINSAFTVTAESRTVVYQTAQYCLRAHTRCLDNAPRLDDTQTDECKMLRWDRQTGTDHTSGSQWTQMKQLGSYFWPTEGTFQ